MHILSVLEMLKIKTTPGTLCYPTVSLITVQVNISYFLCFIMFPIEIDKHQCLITNCKSKNQTKQHMLALISRKFRIMRVPSSIIQSQWVRTMRVLAVISNTHRTMRVPSLIVYSLFGQDYEGPGSSQQYIQDYEGPKDYEGPRLFRPTSNDYEGPGLGQIAGTMRVPMTMRVPG